MTTDLVPFRYDGMPVRTVVIDGEPWFVGGDVARALGYVNPSDALARLDADDRRYATLALSEGSREVSRERTVVNEAGVYQLVFGSSLPDAARFRRWITHDVLPAIRRTGSYSVTPQLQGAELLARAVLEAQSMLAAKDAQIAELAPRAEVADRLLDADGDLSVADAAKALTRAGIDTGATRLFAQLERMRWIYRGQSDGRWRVYQSAIETGWMSVIPQSHHHPRTGELVMDPPQPRVTPKGLQRLMDRLTPATALQPA